MANQIIIDIGAVANDGTGDPLRTAFGYVNNNFSNVWASGVANSNIQFDGNRILTTNTNGNLVLAPNGIGKVQANVDIVPNANNTLSLGSLTRQWNTVYARNLTVAGDTTFNDLTVDGNLTVRGNTIQIGNIVTDTKTIQLANTASTANAANGSGITVGANDNIATMLYSSTSNTWTMNIGANITGNVTAPYFIGNGSLLTGIASPYGNANVAAYLPTYTGNLSSGNLSVSSSGDTWTIEGKTITAPGGAIWYSNPDQSTDDFISAPGSNIRIQALNNSSVVEGQFSLTSAAASLFVNNGISRTWNFNESGNTEFPGCLIPLGAGGVCGNIGNITNPWSNAYISGNVSAGNISLTGTVASNLIPTGNNVQSLGNATNQWNDLYVSNTTIFMNNVPISLTAGNVLTIDGNAVLQNDSNTSITTTGNISASNFFGSGLTATSASATVSLNAFAPDGNTVSIQAQGNTSSAVIETYANATTTTNTWQFGVDGTTTLPNYTLLNPVDEDLYVVVQDADDDGFAIFNRITDEDGNIVAETELQRDRFEITVDVQGAAYNWQFSDNGQLYLPGNVQGNYGASTSFYATDNGSGGSMEMKTVSYIGDTLGSNVRVTQNNATISTGNAAYTWNFDNTGKLTLPGNIVSNVRIAIDNRSAGDPEDIEIYSADDILLQARDRTASGTAEGGDINVYAGDGGSDDGIASGGPGGDISIAGGRGGAGNTNSGRQGGSVSIEAGRGGDGSVTAAAGAGNDIEITASAGGADNGGGGAGGGDVVITAGDTTDVAQDRGSIILSSGDGGDETSLGGYVQVSIPSVGANPGGQWTFTGSGTTLETPANAEIFGPNFGNLTVGSAGNTIITSADYGITTYNWVFDNTGGLTAPGNISTTWLNIGNIGNIVSLEADVKLQIVANAASNTAPYWTFNNDGTLYVPGNISGDNSAPLIVEGSGSGEGYISLPHATFGGEQVAIVNKFGLGNGIRLETNGGNIFFDDTGNLTVPGNIIMPPGTSLTGSGASPAPSISGFTSVSAETLSATGNVTGGNLITSGNLVFSSTQVQSSAYAGGNGHAMMIDTNRTDTYVANGSADKPFKTFAAAIAAVATLNPTGTVPYTFVLMGCEIDEDVDFTPYNFNFITISTTCRSAFNNPVTFGNSALKQLTVRNVEFADTLTITGDGTADQLNDTSFYNVSFNGAVAVTAANSLAFYEAAFFDTVEFVNVNYVYINAAQFNDDWTITVSDSDPVPANGIGPAQVISLDLIANNVYLVDSSASGFIVFQPQNARMGRSAGTYTIPASCIFNPYNSVLIGTWTNNGTATFRNSVSTNAIANVAPTYNGYMGGTAISISGNVTGGNIITAGNVSGNTAGYAIGYRDIPQVSFTGNATIATTDAGKHYYSTQSTSYILTIANNASQGFQVGAAITVVNQGTGTISIAQGSGVTLYLAGNATPGNRSVSTFGMATIMKVATDTWFINGTGVS